MLGHLSQLISKRFSTADPTSISARHYKLCCCDQRHNDILSKSDRACQVYVWSYRHDTYTFIVDISLCKSCICMHAFYTIAIDRCSILCRTFCFQVIFVQSFEFRLYPLTIFNTSKFEILSLQYHAHVYRFHCCQPIKSYQFTESNHLELLTNHVQDSDLKDQNHFSIGHCSCENRNHAVLFTHGWCKGTSRTLKCYWLNFSTLTYLLLFENIHRNFRKLTSFLSISHNRS